MRLIALLLVGVLGALFALAYQNGIRYMPPVFEPGPMPVAIKQGEVSIDASGAYVQSNENGVVLFRAHVPEPSISITGSGPFNFEINNLHPKNRLEASKEVSEQIDGLRRTLTGIVKGTLVLKWRHRDPRNYTFAAIGDSGGGAELEWILNRSHELGADFLLHLGDINYTATDYADAQHVMNNAVIPTFAAIGNHDFFENGKTVYQRVLRDIGPLNYTFILGGVRFVNLDTAASVFPLTSGGRSDLLDRLIPSDRDTGVRDTIVFTHKPLQDPRDVDEKSKNSLEYEHAVSGYESTWLQRRLTDLGYKTLIAGHVHMSSTFEQDGLRTIVSGAGLAHADLMLNKPFATILFGDVLENKPVQFRWVPLKMPMEAHCNPRGLEVLRILGRVDEWKALNERCGRNIDKDTTN